MLIRVDKTSEDYNEFIMKSTDGNTYLSAEEGPLKQESSLMFLCGINTWVSYSWVPEDRKIEVIGIAYKIGYETELLRTGSIMDLPVLVSEGYKVVMCAEKG